MATTKQLLALAWRESRTARRRLLLYMSSIALGVAALVAIDSFAANVTRSVQDESRALLGGDVKLSARNAYSQRVVSLLDSLRGHGYRTETATTFASMATVTRSGATRLVQVRAVSSGFPIHGRITSEPAAAWDAMHGDRRLVVDRSLLVSLDARIGDTVALGTSRFVITGTIDRVPGDAGISAAIGPRVYMPARFLDETGLLVFGSRAEYETVLGIPGSSNAGVFASKFRGVLRAQRVSLSTAAENEFNLTEAIDQLRAFLGIVGLIALLLGGIGVASGVHAFVMRKIDTVAILRCVGATSRQVLTIYVLQAAAMGLLGAVAGALLGVGLQLALPRVLADFLPVDVTVQLAPEAIVLGLVVGTWVALVFALQPLVRLRRISPLQALRRESDADALRTKGGDPLRTLIATAIAASVVLIALDRADDPREGLAMSLAIGVSVGALWGVAALTSWAARRVVRPSWPFTLRQGIAALYRPGNQTRPVVLALGFGVFLVSTLYQVHHSLLQTIGVRIDQARANVVFFDVQQDQRDAVDSIVRASGHQVAQSVPIVPMRIAQVNDRDLTRDYSRSSWASRREYRSTFRDTVVASEKVVEGRWFAAHDRDGLPGVSMERDVAGELKVALGDTIVWNVQGVRVPTVVRSLREVEWARFEPNFFAVFEPRALEGAPRQYVLLAGVSGDQAIARLQREVVSRYPTVSTLDLSLVQRTITDVLSKVTTAIRFLALITLGLAIPVLFSAVAATRRARLREAVLLKTLGGTRRQIGRIMLAEYALLGVLGSVMGLLLSAGAAWALAKWVFEVPFVPTVLPALAVGGAMVAVAIAIGLATGREVFRETPMAALREA